MSALQEQHERWSAANRRLWAPAPMPKLPSATITRLYTPKPIPVRAKKPQTVPMLSMHGYGAAHFAWADAETISAEAEWRADIQEICEKHRTNLREIRSNIRVTCIVDARREIAAYLRARAWSYPQIGRWMNRDHSSVINLLNSAKPKARYEANKAENQNPPDAWRLRGIDEAAGDG